MRNEPYPFPDPPQSGERAFPKGDPGGHAGLPCRSRRCGDRGSDGQQAGESPHAGFDVAGWRQAVFGTPGADRKGTERVSEATEKTFGESPEAPPQGHGIPGWLAVAARLLIAAPVSGWIGRKKV